MYDQWGLEDEVGKYFVFKDRQGRYVALNRLPMGFCYACGIAQGLSLILTTFSCDTEHYSVTVIVHLDNYLFAFKRKTSETDSQSKELQKAVVSTITTFLKRTITVDLQLNELDREEIQMLLQQNETTRWEKIKSLSPTKFTFLGVDYDLEAKKRTAAEKTWNKLATLLAIIFPGGQLNPATTPRHLAMLMGVASWIKRVINIRHTNFNQYRNMAELAYVLWLMPEMWDVPIAPVAFMFTDLFSICKQLQSTKSANHIYPELRQHNEVAICISDASLVGCQTIPTTQPTLPIPSVTQERVRGALRSIDIRYECRSIRRGRLQELSAGGMSDNNLLHISRHSSICSLRRYLDFGLASGENLHRAHLAARATIAAQRKLLTGEQLDTYNQMDAETAPPGRRYNVAGQHWPSGSEISSQSSRSSSASAIGDV